MDRSDWGEPRSRTLTCHDPMATAAAGATMSGLDYLRAVAAGELPPAPISSHFAMRVVKPGRKVAFAEGEVLDAAGKVLATATTNCLVMPG